MYVSLFFKSENSNFKKIISLLDCACGVEAQLERRWYTDTAFDEIQNLYIGMVKQLVFAYGIIEEAVHGRTNSKEVIDLVRKIETKLAKANSDRDHKYWDKRYMDGLINHCMVVHSSNEAARDDLYKTMCDRYGKTGYYFAVGVYNGVAGWDKHCISGEHFCLFRRNGRNAFVLRNRKASSYSNSRYIALARQNWPVRQYKTEMYWDLRENLNNIMKEDNNPAAVAIVRDYNGLREKFNEKAFDTFNYPHTLTIVVAKHPR
uniref:Uncharacterized protein n=1 Tax=Panagrolaimus davidi TaxID=227884 RepID=A0A914PNC7_9BILA